MIRGILASKQFVVIRGIWTSSGFVIIKGILTSSKFFFVATSPQHHSHQIDCAQKAQIVPPIPDVILETLAFTQYQSACVLDRSAVGMPVWAFVSRKGVIILRA